MGIHNFEQIYQGARKNLEKSLISIKNKELIVKFVDDLALEGLSVPRLTKYIITTRLVAERLEKDLDKVKIEELKSFVSKIQQRTDYSPYTKKMYKLVIRRFYKWLHGTKDYPKIVDWITIAIRKHEVKLPSSGDMLDEQDIQKMIDTAIHPRDKALVAMLWESGARVGEVGNCTLGDVGFDKHGVVITVLGKTGSRKIRLIWCVSYLSTWIQNHPFKENKNAPLWINIGTYKHKQEMKYRNMRMMLLRLADKAGITKRVNPHTFRHSRATFMAHHLTEFQMNHYFGWTQGSDMPSTYVHMSGKDVDNAILTMNGLKNEIKKEETQLLPMKCVRCETINSHDSKFCLKCGGAMNIRVVMEQEAEQKHSNDVMSQLLKDNDVQALLMEKLKGIKNGESFI